MRHFASVHDFGYTVARVARQRSRRLVTSAFCAWHRHRRGSRQPPPLARAREILVIRPDEIGDVVLGSPFLRELRSSAPAARITIVVKRGIAPLLAGNPPVDRVVIYDWERCLHRPFRHHDLRWLALKTALNDLRGPVYDYVLMPRRSPDQCEADFLAWCVDSRCIATACDAPGDSAVPDSGPIGPDRSFRGTWPRHETEHSLDFLHWLGGHVANDRLEVWPAEAQRRRGEAFVTGQFAQDGPLVALHPSGGRSPLKQWPLDRFRQLSTELLHRAGARVLLVGGADEAESILAAFPSPLPPNFLNAVGRLGLGELVGALGKSSLFIGGDSGPMHLAAAVGVPVIGLFGPTSEVRFAPRGPLSRVLSARIPCTPDSRGTFLDRCAVCDQPDLLCMKALGVEEVVRAALGVLDRIGRPSPLPRT